MQSTDWRDKVIRAAVLAVPAVVPYLSDRALKVVREGSDYRQRQARRKEQELQKAIADALEKAKQQVLLKKTYNQDDLKANLMAALRTELAQITSDRVSENAKGLSVGFDPAAVDHTVQTWAQQYTYDLIGGLNDTTLQSVQDAISAFTSTPGMTNADLESLLEPAFGEVRAQSIAITEVTRAYAQGESVFQDMMDEDGIDTVRVWLTSEDEKVCPICGDLDGEEAGPGENFKGDVENPPAHPNCRCAVQTRLA